MKYKVRAHGEGGILKWLVGQLLESRSRLGPWPEDAMIARWGLGGVMNKRLLSNSIAGSRCTGQPYVEVCRTQRIVSENPESPSIDHTRAQTRMKRSCDFYFEKPKVAPENTEERYRIVTSRCGSFVKPFYVRR